ncbi:MAG: tetratricopeptide repeat protein [Limisphaerales bacterium]
MTSHWWILLGAILVAYPALGQTGPAPARQAIPGAPTNSPVEVEYQKLQAQDDAAQAEVDRWTRQNNDAKANGGGISDSDQEKRIRERVAPVSKAYEDFLKRYPEHARAHLAYGCFLNDREDETGARREWEKALELEPKNADVYNNLAGSYTETGPAGKAFDFYTKAIELNPTQALYYQNFANSLYVLRKRGMTHYGLDERQIFAKIIQLYSNSVRLEPTNFSYALNLGQTYYSMRPFPAESALTAWSNTLQHVSNQIQREEVLIHLARVQMLAGRYEPAYALLASVTNRENFVLKSNLLHNIELRKNEEK